MKYDVIFDEKGKIVSVKDGWAGSYLPGHTLVKVIEAETEEQARVEASKVWRIEHGPTLEDNGYQKPITEEPPVVGYVGFHNAKTDPYKNAYVPISDPRVKPYLHSKETSNQGMHNTHFVPMNGTILVKKDAAKENSPEIGKVIVADLRTARVLPGQKIVFRKCAGAAIQIDGTDYVLIKEEDVYGALEYDF